VKQGDRVYLTVDGGPTRVPLPYVVGQSSTVATTTLRNSGFQVKVAGAATSDPALIGTVEYEYPPSGSDYPKGTTVTLTVYKALQDETVPSKNVIGEPIATARSTLYALDFLSAVGRYTYSSTYPQGVVITTYPRPGQLAPKGSTIDLIVSNGPAATVPYVQYKQLAQAEALLSAAKLTYSITYVNNTAILPGYVVSQSPNPGAQESPGYAVDITVEQEPATTTTSTTTTTIPSTSGTSGNSGPSGPSGNSGIG